MDKENLLMVNDGETVSEDASVSEDATDKEVVCDNERKEDANSKTEKGNKKYKDSIKELSEYLEEESDKKMFIFNTEFIIIMVLWQEMKLNLKIFILKILRVLRKGIIKEAFLKNRELWLVGFQTIMNLIPWL